MSGSWPSSLGDLQRRLDELFEEVIYRRWPRSSTGGMTTGKEWVPAADLYELPDAFLIDIALPGVSPDEARIELAPRAITIAGERTRDLPIGLVSSVWECPSGPFRRTVELSAAIDVERVEPCFRHGLLRILAPKRNAAEWEQPRTDSGT